MRALILISLAGLAACGQAASREAGPVASRSFDLKDFNRVTLQGSDDVKIVRGAQFSVIARGPSNMLDQLAIGVEGNTLKIDRIKRIGWSWKGGEGVVVTVTMPTVNGVELAGSGDMSVSESDAASFDASLAGSGNLKLDRVQAQSVKLELAGSGNIDAAGRSTTVETSTAGSGDIAAAGLIATTADVSLAGSGNVAVHASRSAKISLMGSGDVTVTGTDQCSTTKMGSGSVVCRR